MPRIHRFSFLISILFVFTSCGVWSGGKYDLGSARHVGHSPYFHVDQIDLAYDERMVPKLSLEITKEVEYSINYFLTKDPKYLSIARTNRAKYEPEISQIFKQHNLPLELMHVATIESMFKPRSRSSYGAVGMWQFVAGTARHCGLKVNLLTDQRKDPYLSTEAAACYLLELYSEFKDWRWALAAYNYGPPRIKRFKEKYSHLDFWEIARLRSFPSQTKAYVSRVFAAAILEKHRVQPRFYSYKESAVILAQIRRLYPFV